MASKHKEIAAHSSYIIVAAYGLIRLSIFYLRSAAGMLRWKC